MKQRLCALLEDIPGVAVAGIADDSVSACLLIRAMLPDVVILDIRLASGSGIEVLREIKAESPSPLVIMLTNYSEPQFRETCLTAGADYFLDKSKEFDRLREILAKRTGLGSRE
jgi:DNA-binding NarL/FixJ family response regulator